MTRRKKLDESVTKKITSGCCKLRITANMLKNGAIDGIYTASGKSGGCKALLEGLSRLTYLSLKYAPIEEVIDQLEHIFCPACKQRKGELPKEERASFPNSCPDAMAGFLKDLIEEEILTRAKTKEGSLIEVVGKDEKK